MSKLYQTYAALKMQDSSYLYLFKSQLKLQKLGNRE